MDRAKKALLTNMITPPFKDIEFCIDEGFCSMTSLCIYYRGIKKDKEIEIINNGLRQLLKIRKEIKKELEK